MRKILSFIVCLVVLNTTAQITTPQASTSAKIEQVVGLTSIEISYARPAVKGRSIFGDLVPFNKKWRTGANENTSISFSDDVTIEGKAVPAGTYAIYSTPNKKAWTIYLYSKTDSWGLPQTWEEEKIVAQFEVKSFSVNPLVENFTIQVKDIQSDQANIQIAWEKTAVEFTVKVPTDNKVMTSIKETMAEGAKARDYYNAAVYYYSEGKDINQAVEWVDMAMKMQDEKPFWMLRQQSLIYHKAGKKQEAIQLAEASLEAAKKAGNEDYVKMNMASLKEWK